MIPFGMQHVLIQNSYEHLHISSKILFQEGISSTTASSISVQQELLMEWLWGVWQSPKIYFGQKLFYSLLPLLSLGFMVTKPHQPTQSQKNSLCWTQDTFSICFYSLLCCAETGLKTTNRINFSKRPQTANEVKIKILFLPQDYIFMGGKNTILFWSVIPDYPE